jgi:hypothetical protein
VVSHLQMKMQNPRQKEIRNPKSKTRLAPRAGRETRIEISDSDPSFSCFSTSHSFHCLDEKGQRGREGGLGHFRVRDQPQRCPLGFLLIIRCRRDVQCGGSSFVHLTQFHRLQLASRRRGGAEDTRPFLPCWRYGGGVASDEIFIGQMPPLSASGMRFLAS